MGKLQGKVAVITGGTEGIGFATARLFVDEGAYVFITGRRKKELDEAVAAIGSNVAGVQGDVAKLADLDRLYETVGKAKSRIDIIFANAGVGEAWLKRELRATPKRSGTLHGSLLKQEKEMIEAALAASQGRISGPSGAAAKLGLPSRTLDSKIKRLKINVYRFKTPR